jgi:hypothetical protein
MHQRYRPFGSFSLVQQRVHTPAPILMPINTWVDDYRSLAHEGDSLARREPDRKRTGDARVLPFGYDFDYGLIDRSQWVGARLTGSE